MEGQTGDLTRFGRRQSCGGQCGEEAGDTYEAWGLVGGGTGRAQAGLYGTAAGTFASAAAE